MADIESANRRVIEGMRTLVRRRKRDALTFLVGAVAFVATTAWLYVYSRPVDQQIQDLRSTVATHELTTSMLRREIWYAYDMAVLKARLDRGFGFLSIGTGVLLGLALSRLLRNRSDVLLELCDRVDAIERRLTAGTGGPASSA